MRTYTENLEYQGLLSAFQKAKEILKAAQAEKKEIEAFFKTTKKEKKATKNAVSISHFQFKQAKLKKKSEELATRIARLNLKEWIQSFKKTEKTVVKMTVKKDEVKMVQPKNGVGTQTDVLEKPSSKSKSKSEKTKKTVKIVDKKAEKVEMVKPKVVKDKAVEKVKIVKKVDVVVEKTEPIVAVKAIVKKVQKPTQEVKKVEKKEVGVSKITPINDLTVIEGIGPKIAKILSDNNVTNFKALIATPVENIKTWLKENKLPFIDPTTWAEQAQLVDTGKISEFEDLKKVLKNGKRV
jgi:predicted flap endonuclease-1-like 5' DNA nuclease